MLLPAPSGAGERRFMDRVIRRQKVKDKKEAENVMKAWAGNAPAGVICQML